MFISLDLSSISFSVKLAYVIIQFQTLLLSDFTLMSPPSNKLLLVCLSLQTFNFLRDVCDNQHRNPSLVPIWLFIFLRQSSL